MSNVTELKIPINVGETLQGKNVLIIGTTGFVGKVLLSLLLTKYPNIGKVFLLIRGSKGKTPEQRFTDQIADSEPMRPLKAKWGSDYYGFLDEKIEVVGGDISIEKCGFTEETLHRFEKVGGLDLIVNSAGLVSFTPALEEAIAINAEGALNVLEAARFSSAKLMHVSTCYVAGFRDGEVYEDDQVVGYFPRRNELPDRDFDARAEIEDCWRAIRHAKNVADDRAHVSEFREKATALLRKQRRDPNDPIAMEDGVATMRKKWLRRRLTKIGMDRAAHWGWTNTYTYTKSLGEQVLLSEKEVPVTVVRPAIVESALEFPFPGWNEGYNTTAPLIYLVLKGQRQIVVRDVPIDVVPVDHVCAGMVAGMAALLLGRHKPVYALSTSHSNPITSKRTTELIGLAVRRHHLANAKTKSALLNKIRARLEVMSVDAETFHQKSAPRLGRLAAGASKLLDERLPAWGAPRLQAWGERAKEELGKVSKFTGQVTSLVDLFKPFTWDCDIKFRNDNTLALFSDLTPEDRDLLPWEEKFDWRHYFLNVHFPGLKKWVFPVLDKELGNNKTLGYVHRDMLELFNAACELNKHRPALKRWRLDKPRPQVYTYAQVKERSEGVAVALKKFGVSSGDKVMLISESRPEWVISYFGILKAGAVAVPVDPQMGIQEVKNLVEASGAKICLTSNGVALKFAQDLGGDPMAWLRTNLPGKMLMRFSDVMRGSSEGFTAPPITGDTPASIIFTSGTTGTPKGVVLTHKNFASMAAQMSSMFKLYRHDSLLSVLPLHHTFEFSSGMLMPLMHGSSINYLAQAEPAAINHVLKNGNITAMVGVPAVWQLFNRKIHGKIKEKGPFVTRAFDSATDFHRVVREQLPYQTSLGKVFFYPIHKQMGGRLRLLISGGAALSPKVMKSMQGMGFTLYEGYGMTEASPVLTVQPPGKRVKIGSVGKALPGVTIKIDDPDENGVGEVIAKGPNVMAGYHENETETARTLKKGWLHTGDLGKLDRKGNLYIVGRKKDMILGAAGENIYPDEIEDLYSKTSWIKEMSVVGLPAGEGETVCALVVPDYDKGTRSEVQEQVREHMANVSRGLQQAKRIKIFHLWDHDLPRTSTRKVKRAEVVAQLQKLEAESNTNKFADAENTSTSNLICDVVATVCHRDKSEVSPAATLEALGFDSLMLAELVVALERRGFMFSDANVITNCISVSDVIEACGEAKSLEDAENIDADAWEDPERERAIPEPLILTGRKVLRFGQKRLYSNYLNTKVTGRAYAPAHGGYIIAANHSSHLDMGLVKHAIGEYGDLLVALAAKDYFFDDPVRRVYFENFTNLVPMERHGSLRESLRLAGDMLREGRILLIFPEGTRSRSGKMIDFKPSLGYLALNNQCGILPMFLGGTYRAMPPGRPAPTRGKRVQADIAPYLSYEKLMEMTAGKRRGAAYKQIATECESQVRGRATDSDLWMLGEAGRETYESFSARRAGQEPESASSKKEESA